MFHPNREQFDKEGWPGSEGGGRLDVVTSCRARGYKA